MRSQVQCPLRSQVRRQALTQARRRLLRTYQVLALRRQHLLAAVLDHQAPRQWAHYPQDDAIDSRTGYQWFYHSHAPHDRPDALAHGHIHLFARQPLWSRRLQSGAEKAFHALTGAPALRPRTRHLLAISFDAKGIARRLFTVNSWVTGDLMLSAPLTMELLEGMRLGTGYGEVDAVIECVVRLCAPEIRQMLFDRDATLASHPGRNTLADERLEILSEVYIDLDEKLRT